MTHTEQAEVWRVRESVFIKYETFIRNYLLGDQHTQGDSQNQSCCSGSSGL